VAFQDTEAALFGTFGPRYTAKSTFGASLKPFSDSFMAKFAEFPFYEVG
jgi:hypothetical protein